MKHAWYGLKEAGKDPTFLTFWTDVPSFPSFLGLLKHAWYGLQKNGEKPCFPYILEGFSVIFFRFSLIVHRETLFLYILDGFPVIPLRFSLVFSRENTIFLTFMTDILSFPSFLGL